MAIVTISREFGSEGNWVSRNVSEALDYHYVFKKEICEIFDLYGIALYEKVHEPRPSFWTGYDEAREEAAEFLVELIQTIAHHNNVIIVGRCSCSILHDFSDVLNVRIQAPVSVKVTRIMKELSVTREKAARLIEKEDIKRAKLFHMYCNSYGEWNVATAFDMVLDTGKLLPEMAVNLIVDAVKHLEKQVSDDRPTVRMIDVNPALDKIVSEILNQEQDMA